MGYRKWQAPRIHTGKAWAPEQSVLITSEDGIVLDMVAAQEAGEDIVQYNGIICPGFVNAHCHLELSHLKGHIAPRSGMVDFVKQVMQLKRFSEQEKKLAMMDALAEMHHNGIVAVGDISNTTDSLMVKTGSDLYFHNFIEISGFVPATMQDRWVAGEKIAAAFMEHFPAKQVTITPHAPYSVSPGLLETIQKYESRKLLSMHLLESEEEIQFFKEKQGDFLKLYAQLGISLDFFIPAGKDSLRQYWPIMKNHAPWLWVHNTEMGKHDLEWLNEQGLDWNQIYFCLCPQANEYINSAMPSIHRFRHQYPMQLCLGTDSLAGNYCLSMVFEMRLLQKKGHLSDLEFLLQMATLNGAKALGIHNQFGSFEKGKMPGIVLLEGVDGEILTPKAKASRLS